MSASIWSYSITQQFKDLVANQTVMAYIQDVEENVYKCILANGDINVNEEIGKMLAPNSDYYN